MRERLSAQTVKMAEKMSLSELGRKYNEVVQKVVNNRKKRKMPYLKRIFRAKAK